jgi:hypothetical protein
LPVTVIPVLVGSVPGVTETVKRVEPPACTEDGFDAPVAVGEVEEDVTVSVIVAEPVLL